MSLVKSRDVSDSDSEATIDPNEEETVAPSKGSGRKPYQFKKRYSSTVHEISDSDSDTPAPAAASTCSSTLAKTEPFHELSDSDELIPDTPPGKRRKLLHTKSPAKKSPVKPTTPLKSQPSNVSVHEISDSDTEDESIVHIKNNSSKSKQNTSSPGGILSQSDAGKKKPSDAKGRMKGDTVVSGKSPLKSKPSNTSMHEMSDSDTEDESTTNQRNCSAKSEHRTVLKHAEGKNGSKSSADLHASLKHDLADSDEEMVKEAVPSGSGKSGDAADTRPVCKYGTRCFRKNPTHHKNFQHLDIYLPFDEESPSKQVKDESEEGTASQISLQNVSEVVRASRPLGFLLTKVTGIDSKYNRRAIHIKEILSPMMGQLQRSAQFNYCIDVPWLIEQYPPEFRTKPMTVVHGFIREEKRALEAEAKLFPHVTLCQAKLEILYGTHHTKMMLLQYDDGLRIVISTANLVEKDWYQKTQGLWISEVFPPLSEPSVKNGDSPTHFKRDMIEYLEAYNAPLLADWIKIIQGHDLSSACVYLIGSVPGRHTGDRKSSWGHMKMRKILVNKGPQQSLAKSWDLIAQFSSVGSLGGRPELWLCGEWLLSLAACRGSTGSLSASKVRLVFPDRESIRTSLEGYPAGQSVPYSIKTAVKQTYMADFWHHWRSEKWGRSRAIPHIKTFLRVSPDSNQIAWVLVTSANMSKAAWGQLEKGGSQLMIRSYELGVLFLPQSFGDEETFGVDGKTGGSNDQLKFPVPFDLPPTQYSQKDRPWVWDIPYVNLPDTHGNKWCPQ